MVVRQGVQSFLMLGGLESFGDLRRLEKENGARKSFLQCWPHEVFEETFIRVSELLL